MHIKQLIYLDALARERHFGRAAQACNISQPTLSAALAQLEEELGVLIVERGRQYRGLTREGEVVLAHARRVLAEGETLRETIAEMRVGLSGRLRLGAIPTALPMVTHLTAPFSAAYPGVALTVLSLTSQEIQSRIDNFELDVGLTYLDNEPLERVIAKPVYQEAYILLAREDAAIAQRESVSWHQAAQLDLCLLTKDMQNRRIIDGIFRSVGVSPQPLMETNSIFNLVSHAGLSRMCSIVSRQLLEYFGLPKGIRAIPLVEPEASRVIGLIAAERAPLAPVVRNLFSLVSPVGGQASLAPLHSGELSIGHKTPKN